MAEDWQNGGFGIYIHWPFCEAKCPYCDFNSYVSRTIDQDRWKAAYLSELQRARSEIGLRTVSSLFFGGGTPSLMRPDIVESIISEVAKLWPLANDLEITLEANPSSVEASRFMAYRDAGVSRVSMGIQALNNTDLRRLGRLHTVEEAQKALQTAQSTFTRVSFDLIYARQDQSPSAWEAELKQALDMSSGHLSLYQLTIEPNTAFGDRYKAGKLAGLPIEDDAADMYEITQSLCEDYDMPAYEVSNHAKQGEESRHNLIYWKYGDYLGIGPGAHGRLSFNGQRFATETHLAPGKWLSSVEASGNGENLRSNLSLVDQGQEFLLMGLRLRDGISLTRLKNLYFEDISTKIRDLEEIGVIKQDGDRLMTTRAGRPVLNSVLAALV